MNERFLIFTAAVSIVIIFVVSISLYQYGTPDNDPVKSGSPQWMTNTPQGGHITFEHVVGYQQMKLNLKDTLPINSKAKSASI